MPANVLLIHADQHRYDCVAANGHPLLQTPNLDRLAREGVNFTHAFCPIPVCMPARVSLVTGQWPARHGCIANADTEPLWPSLEGVPTLNGLFKAAGYYVGHVGKWHVHPHKPPTAFGCDDYIPEGEYGRWREAQGLPPRPRRNSWFGEVDPYITPAQSRLTWGADATIGLLRRAANQGRPFFIRWDPAEPHLPNVVPEPYASLYPPAAIAPWPSYPDPLVGKPYIQRKQRETWGVASWTWQEWAPVVARYLGEITLLDHQVGRVLDALDELGLAEETLVVYSADHGDLCGGHGMVDKHFVMYEELVRVPLLLRWPRRLPAGRVCDAFVSSALDLAVTFCRAAGLQVPETFAGQDLLPLARGEADEARTDIFATYHGNQFGLYSQRMVRDRRWKYVWNATAEDELYDLEADPGEIHNRAADPACRQELARLRGRLLAWMEATGDRLLNPWTRRQLVGSGI
ncbi:sulfatase-like hydrolase/transferase [Litorilinea aerophila]|uniref:Sulfatase-like hydrolase/transferase n=1 Tax=Litorilinea aerophila TaxID=1204385 RepID=A0A540VCU9_9CHLR|nr:sulfatase-like hydrolase/transferase [Litorilinea aerophila]MCC9077647.1 sulfatase-like hydrolase/transferase [Litorilinea aerophila]